MLAPVIGVAADGAPPNLAFGCKRSKIYYVLAGVGSCPPAA
jgi:hypothetical protein